MRNTLAWLGLALLSSGASAGEDPPAAWRSARWGMTADEVLVAFDGEAARVRASCPDASQPCALVEIAQYGADYPDFRVEFLFAGGKLASIRLRPEQEFLRSCIPFDVVLQSTVERHGQPAALRDERGTREATWRTPGALVTLRCRGRHSVDDGEVVLTYLPPAAPPAPDQAVVGAAAPAAPR